MLTRAPLAFALVAARAGAETRDVGGERPEQLLERSDFVRSLVERTRANAPRRRIERENRSCIQQRAYGVGDCAGVDEDVLREALLVSEEAFAS